MSEIYTSFPEFLHRFHKVQTLKYKYKNLSTVRWKPRIIAALRTVGKSYITVGWLEGRSKGMERRKWRQRSKRFWSMLFALGLAVTTCCLVMAAEGAKDSKAVQTEIKEIAAIGFSTMSDLNALNGWTIAAGACGSVQRPLFSGRQGNGSLYAADRGRLVGIKVA